MFLVKSFRCENIKIKCHNFIVKNKDPKLTLIFAEFLGQKLQNNENGVTKSQNILFGRWLHLVESIDVKISDQNSLQFK